MGEKTIMLTNKDVKNIVDNVIKAEKELFYTKTEFDKKFAGLENSFTGLQTSVDNMTKTFKRYYEKRQVLLGKLKHIED